MIGGDLDAWDGELAVRQLVELVDLGVTHVVDARSEWSDEELVGHLAPHVDYLHAGIDDAGQRVPEEWFETVAQWGAAALAEPDAVVLAHCHAGINRGPSAGLAILLAVGWDVADALAAIRSARPFAWTDYAEDALRWHHARTGASEQQRRVDEEALARLARRGPVGPGHGGAARPGPSRPRTPSTPTALPTSEAVDARRSRRGGGPGRRPRPRWGPRRSWRPPATTSCVGARTASPRR